MKCPNCGAEMDGNLCSYCGTQLQQTTSTPLTDPETGNQGSYNYGYGPGKSTPPDNRPPKEKWYKRTWVIILFLLFLWPVGLYLMWKYKKDWSKAVKIIISILVALIMINYFSTLGKVDSRINSTSTVSEDADSKKPDSKKDTAKKEEPKEPAAVLEPYETDLSAGYYTAGIDFPAGTYTITAVSGYGNVSSDNMYTGGLNEILSNPADEYSIDTFNNARLDSGVVLSVGSTCVIHLSSPEADVSGVNPRGQSEAAPIDLGSGNFVAGTDFPEGIYTVIGTGEAGNVSSDNMYAGGLNEIMGPGGDDFSIHEFKNATFEAGTTLSISGTSVQLVPVSPQ